MADSHSESESGIGVSQHAGDMYLHTYVFNTVLVRDWKTGSWQELLLASFFTAFVGFCYHALLALREYVAWKHSQFSKEAGTPVEDKPKDENSSLTTKAPRSRYSIYEWHHVLQSLLYFVQVWLSILGMLLIMTFSFYLCLALTVGKSLGYYCFAWIANDFFKTDSKPRSW